jgi:hypothetical protein
MPTATTTASSTVTTSDPTERSRTPQVQTHACGNTVIHQCSAGSAIDPGTVPANIPVPDDDSWAVDGQGTIHATGNSSASASSPLPNVPLPSNPTLHPAEHFQDFESFRAAFAAQNSAQSTFTQQHSNANANAYTNSSTHFAPPMHTHSPAYVPLPATEAAQNPSSFSLFESIPHAGNPQLPISTSGNPRPASHPNPMGFQTPMRGQRLTELFQAEGIDPLQVVDPWRNAPQPQHQQNSANDAWSAYHSAHTDPSQNRQSSKSFQSPFKPLTQEQKMEWQPVPSFPHPNSLPEIPPMPNTNPLGGYERWQGDQFEAGMRVDEARERFFAEQERNAQMPVFVPEHSYPSQSQPVFQNQNSQHHSAMPFLPGSGPCQFHPGSAQMHSNPMIPNSQVSVAFAPFSTAAPITFGISQQLPNPTSQITINSNANEFMPPELSGMQVDSSMHSGGSRMPQQVATSRNLTAQPGWNVGAGFQNQSCLSGQNVFGSGLGGWGDDTPERQPDQQGIQRDQLLTCFCLLICSLIHLLVFIRVMALRPHLFQLHLFLARRILEMVHMFLHNRILSHRQILNFSMHEVLIRDIISAIMPANQA